MELELKILKEKVVDDEKNSGIGSLFDDEKTSHQHIDLLKTKYIKMRRDFDILEDRMNNKMIDVKGNPVVCDQVWISYFTGGGDNMGEGFGKLVKAELFTYLSIDALSVPPLGQV